jgi:glycosyltransferase involved in cell wall biosynthesis
MNKSNKKINVLFVTPIPPQITGVGEYASDLIVALSKFEELNITVLTNNTKPKKISNVKIINEYCKNTQYNIIIHQLGNNGEFHQINFDILKKYGGIVQLHDPVIHQCLFYLIQNKNSKNSEAHKTDIKKWILLVGSRLPYPLKWLLSKFKFIHRLKKSLLGYTSSHSPHSQLEIEFFSLLKKWYPKSFEMLKFDLGGDLELFSFCNSRNIISYPLFEEALQFASGVIVHSNMVQNLVQRTFPNLPVSKMAMIHKSSPPKKSYQVKNSYKIGVFGQYEESRHYDKIIVAFRRFLEDSHDFSLQLYIVGNIPNTSYLKSLSQKIKSKVKFCKPHVDSKRFEQRLAEMDLVVQLRDPTRGEASGIVSKAIELNICCIVSNNGWYSELPNFVEKVPVPITASAIYNSLLNFFYPTSVGQSIQQRINETIKYNSFQHNHEIQSKKYFDFILEQASKN